MIFEFLIDLANILMETENSNFGSIGSTLFFDGFLNEKS
jgi:hypothetical protein